MRRGLRSQINESYYELLHYLPNASSLWPIATEMRDAINRQGMYTGRAWKYRTERMAELVDSVAQIAAKERIGQQAIKAIKSMNDVAATYVRQNDIADGHFVVSKLEQNTQTLDNIVSRLGTPLDYKPTMEKEGISKYVMGHEGLNGLEVAALGGSQEAYKTIPKNKRRYMDVLKSAFRREASGWLRFAAASATGLALIAASPEDYSGYLEKASNAGRGIMYQAQESFGTAMEKRDKLFHRMLIKENQGQDILGDLLGPMKPFYAEGKVIL